MQCAQASCRRLGACRRPNMWDVANGKVMGTRATRDHIVEAADQLFYQQGFERTSFSDIAKAVQISRGNFYHHFKSKDDILLAVIDHRLEKTQKMLERWEREGTGPEGRIKSFIHILIANSSNIMSYGCPVGTLCSELVKLEHASQAEANKLFGLFRSWLRKQFKSLGRNADADRFAMHILGRSQGVAMLTNALRDEEFVRQEVEQMDAWVAGLSKGR